MASTLKVYKDFFQLQRSPFEMSPDPHFLYPTGRHHEALACLYYAIGARKGFVVLVGEVGTGKTLMVRCLLEKLQKGQVQYAYIFNPLLTAEEFLRYIAADLGLPGQWKGKSDLLLRLNEFLIRQNNQGRTTVLVVDEAHLLTPEVLEESRLLSNLETPQGKLLQIALVGQPELDEKLDSPVLRQLKQRIALRCQLQPLSRKETQEYVNWRLKRAGANGEAPIFPAETLQAIHQYSHGYPRLINTICENTLISAFAAGCRTISLELVEETCRDLRISVESPPGSNQQVEPNLITRSVDSSAAELVEGSVDSPQVAKPPEYGYSKPTPEAAS